MNRRSVPPAPGTGPGTGPGSQRSPGKNRRAEPSGEGRSGTRGNSIKNRRVGPVGHGQPERQTKRIDASSQDDAAAMYQNKERGERLQKALATAGVASRRECEELIEAGRVAVNGVVVKRLPAWVDAERDRVTVDGNRVALGSRSGGHLGSKSTRQYEGRSGSRSGSRSGGDSLGPEGDRVYVILNKPRRVVSTTRDPQGRRCVTDLVDLPGHLSGRLYPVGRLDADSTGLILLTNDGAMAQVLTHPSHEVAKRYHVWVRGQVTRQDAEKLKAGLVLAQKRLSKSRRRSPGPAGNVTNQKNDEPTAVKRARAAEVTVAGYERGRNGVGHTRLAVVLREGQNRQIRRMLARLGYKVRRLQRVAIGPITVKGLALGQWRLLTNGEVQKLKKCCAGRLAGTGAKRGA